MVDYSIELVELTANLSLHVLPKGKERAQDTDTHSSHVHEVVESQHESVEVENDDQQWFDDGESLDGNNNIPRNEYNHDTVTQSLRNLSVGSEESTPSLGIPRSSRTEGEPVKSQSPQGTHEPTATTVSPPHDIDNDATRPASSHESIAQEINASMLRAADMILNNAHGRCTNGKLCSHHSEVIATNCN